MAVGCILSATRSSCSSSAAPSSRPWAGSASFASTSYAAPRASLAHVALNLNDLNPVLGPSAAVAGVLAAYLMLHPKTTVLAFRLYRLRVRLYPHILLLAWVVVQIFATTTARGPVESVTAPLLVAGFVAGLIFVIPLRLPDVPLLPPAEPEEDAGTERPRDEQA